MSCLLFIVYFIAACYFLCKSSWLAKTGLPVFYRLFFFLAKTIAGCYYGYWYAKPQNIANADTWFFHDEAIKQYHLLFHEPGKYFTNLSDNDYGHWGGIVSPSSFWHDLRNHLIIKIFSLMDVLSGGHYYVNGVIYSFVTFFGLIACWLACKNVIGKAPGLLTTGIIFLMPSCLFWTSGLHRDGFVLLFTGLCLLYGSLIFGTGAKKRKYFFLLLISFAGLMVFRSYVAVLLIPAFTAWALSKKYGLKHYILFPAVAAAFTGLFFLLPFVVPSVNLPAKLIEWKNEFETLEANSRLPGMNLLPDFGSFARNFFLALDRAFLRPYIWQAKNLLELVAALEILLAVVLIAVVVFHRKNKMEAFARRFQWTIILFCAGNMILVGYVVPFTGAIVRYRAIFVMLLLAISSFDLLVKQRKVG